MATFRLSLSVSSPVFVLNTSTSVYILAVMVFYVTWRFLSSYSCFLKNYCFYAFVFVLMCSPIFSSIFFNSNCFRFTRSHNKNLFRINMFFLLFLLIHTRLGLPFTFLYIYIYLSIYLKTPWLCWQRDAFTFSMHSAAYPLRCPRLTRNQRNPFMAPSLHMYIHL